MESNENQTNENSPESGDKKILEEAHLRFNLSDNAWNDIRRLALEDIEFSVGNQWPESIKNERERDGRPCLVINRIPQFVQQVTNDQRQNRPAIKVGPVDDKADIETAKVIQGIVRHIEYNSNAEAAYDTAFDSAVRGGFGFYRVVTEYLNETSFDQEIKIKRIKNPFSVFLDPFSSEPDGSDASFAFVTEDISKDDYKNLYPKSKLSSTGEWESVGNSMPLWMPDGSARVAEYFYKEKTEQTIVLLSNNETYLKSDLLKLGELPEGVTEVKERTTTISKVCWVKMNGFEILERTEWLGKYIPIIPVYGSEVDVNGKRILESIVRHAKDPARMYNYWVSAETEAIALAPRAPFIAAEGQLEGYENDWESANRRNHSVLIYKPTDVKGNMIGPPQRQGFEPAVQAITQARMMASDDMKATTGIYDSSLGNNSRETSGVAIQRRNVQSQTSNFHFIDNLTRSLRHTGRILIDLIPKIYDTERSVRIIGEDGDQEIKKVNAPFTENGKEVLYALDAGTYDVTVDVGPSFQTKRQEATTAMLELSKTVPQMMNIAPDLIVRNMDFPGAQELSERFKKTLPPGLADDKGQPPIPPQIQQKIQGYEQLIDKLTGTVHSLQGEKEQKLLELESKERIEFKKLEVQLEIKRAEMDAKDSLALLNHEIDSINQRLQILNVTSPIDNDPQDFQSSQQTPQQIQDPQSMNGDESAGSQNEFQTPTGGQSPGESIGINP